MRPGAIVSRRLAVLLSTGAWVGLRPGASRADGPRVDATSHMYDSYAPTYDALDGGLAASRLGFDELRRVACARAHGAVLEVGAGTGLNLPLYDWSRVRSLVALDASSGMLDVARARADGLGLAGKVTFARGDVAALPFDDGTFDVVLDTFSLCVFADPIAAMAEMRRVLAPSGTIIAVEHQRADGLLGAYQDLTEPLVTPRSKGCVWNQDVRAIARRAGCREVEARDSLAGTVVSLVLQR
ncbi:hypothetical protein KFE25_009160 [Diacronema lutheri]|uniref:Methyltransferase type 11 domain-containing protein n=1 Tax=Diacronema lutheri TaxID=2081491 RepID=A0A8J6CFI3_DIALT|nr:hypothetical protein KFE25_009160 [Diacronema lutheri]